jgi:DNA replication initiation complex subunit (GINS family)
MYDELYSAWVCEVEDANLSNLPPDFYQRVVEYMKRIKEELRMIDKKTLRATLLEAELRNMKLMVKELISIRCKKLVKLATSGRKPSAEALAKEEVCFYGDLSQVTEAYQRFKTAVLQGQFASPNEKIPARVVIRALKNIPAIIGADMKTYGPFIPEDVASVPLENAKILVKQSLAKVIEPR